jgi:hypothetical protein
MPLASIKKNANCIELSVPVLFLQQLLSQAPYLHKESPGLFLN